MHAILLYLISDEMHLLKRIIFYFIKAYLSALVQHEHDIHLLKKMLGLIAVSVDQHTWDIFIQLEFSFLKYLTNLASTEHITRKQVLLFLF